MRGGGVARPQLVVLSGPHCGDVLVLDDALPVVFGTRAGVSLPEPALDAVHCQVFSVEGRWFVQDFGSPAGTWLGDERVEGVRPLPAGRAFRIGQTHLALVSADAAAEASPLAAAPEGRSEAVAARSDLAGGGPAARDGPRSLRAPAADQAPAPPASPLARHDVLGDYDILELLGEGCVGRVYKGYDRRRRRVVAVKVLRSELAEDPRAVARFLRGAKAGARLSHPHLVRVLAAGHAAGLIYVTMEYVDGTDLERFCAASGGRLLPRVALGMALRVSDALAAAHAAGVLHRNVTPSNVLVGPGGFPKLADLALAKRPRSRGEGAEVTAEGQPLARNPYASPEAIFGEELDERSDVWGLGATLFRALCGVAPYGETFAEAAARAARGEREDPRAHGVRLSSELEDVLDRCLRLAPSERPSDAASLRSALAAVPELGGATASGS
ncbi:MAG: FHA domain-containing protein [Planctomycetota bacterium]|nr:MAG: FHA domain-containing protein [Planctomycetota bacterium]